MKAKSLLLFHEPFTPPATPWGHRAHPNPPKTCRRAAAGHDAGHDALLKRTTHLVAGDDDEDADDDK